jgi:hypothetical protein
MAASSVMTLRIDPRLLEALKARARREGRSVSAEVIRLIRKDVEAVPERRRRGRTMGMFAEFEAPDLDELKRERRSFSASIRVRAARRRRARIKAGNKAIRA